jgi:hypothetical protein
MAASVTAFDGTLDYTGASGDSMIGLDGYEYDQAIAPFYTSTPSIVALFAGDGSDRELKVRRTLSESFGSTPSGMTTLETKKIGLYGEIVGHYREAQKH